ncbi:hypothetical protein GYA28_00720 [Candidatus Roizmanbacteria bacterium]|jgi:hypothetical protein|nr:hypothetical protein [Candidatus Roizmanbacteria bacterium]
MKTLVSHISVDLDSIVSCWLIKKFLPGWDKACLVFVSSGSTLNNLPPDDDPDVIHVDTGMGRFDHHQIKQRLSATRRVFDYLSEKSYIEPKNSEALDRMVEYVTAVDNFQEVYFPDPTADYHDFSIYQTIEGLKIKLLDDLKVMDYAFPLIDGLLLVFKNKINAEKEIKKGYSFTSRWGRSIALETGNEDAVRLAQKMGYTFVIRKDPNKGYIRIKTVPDPKYNLAGLYAELVAIDPKATWYLHVSGNMLLNGSSTKPNAVPSTLTLQKVIEIARKM